MLVKTHNTTSHEPILYAFLEAYEMRIKSIIDLQFSEEDFKGSSNEQYKGLMLLYTYRLCEIIQKLCNFNTYEYIYEKYNLASVKKSLAIKGINFDEILKLFSIPNNNTECVHGAIVDVDGIGILQESTLVTTHHSTEPGVPSVGETFDIYFGTLEEEQEPSAIIIAASDTQECSPNGSTQLQFTNFDNKFPFIAIPTTVTISSIREAFSNYDVTEGYILDAGTYVIDEVDYKLYLYVYATASTDEEPYIVNVNYTSI